MIDLEELKKEVDIQDKSHLYFLIEFNDIRELIDRLQAAESALAAAPTLPQDSAKPVRERRLSQHSGHERDVQIRQQSLHRFNSANYTIEPAKRRLSDIKLEGHVERGEL